MANKILLKHKGDVGDFYEPSDSENEYTEREKNLLKKVRKGRQRNTDAQQEILAFKPQEDSDEEQDYDDDDDDLNENFGAESDIEDGDDDDEIPDVHAWGKNRRVYHSTDFVDPDYSSFNQREQELAEQEETEALAIQQRLAKQLEESDFTLDVFGTTEPKESDDKKKKSDEIYLQKDLSQLSQRQREQLFKKESPEFEGLVQDFRQRLAESIKLLEPLLAYFKENSIESHPLIEFITNQNQLILNYCTNVSFYLILKAKRIPVQNHPIVKRLFKIRQLLLQIDEKYTTVVKPQLEQIQQAIKDGVEFNIGMDEVPAEKKEKKKLRFVQDLENGNDSDSEMESDDEEPIEKDDDLDFKQKLKLMESDSEGEKGEEDENNEDMDGEDEERRQITYQIAKNKGLTPYRKKELRNPRVKHRNKFRKALIRRKGAHRTPRKEIKRYDGEKFGISARVKKGIKIK
ncbi:something about silencing protein 10 [Contarinia nasturtii]|uniref:something about silencing protein 10 n=1 Tax=Contarinia nasturtii TaxID=265458 RepID=UPI0012D40188|nr:something about silencing protein 10 [Contarinia nasturtii]